MHNANRPQANLEIPASNFLVWSSKPCDDGGPDDYDRRQLTYFSAFEKDEGPVAVNGRSGHWAKLLRRTCRLARGETVLQISRRQRLLRWSIRSAASSVMPVIL